MSLTSDLTTIFSDLTGKTAAVKASEISAAIGGGFKLGSFTRDLTAASGSVNITDVGFQPSVVVFLSGLTGTTSGSSYVGIDDATTHGSVGVYGGSAQTTLAYSLVLVNDGSNYQRGIISSMLSNGFTVAWNKIGSPTGTGTVYYLALKLAT